MTQVDDLQARFGRDEAIFFSREEGDLVCVNLRTERGATARISLYGGQLLSWCTSDGIERIFLSSKALFQPGKAIRGGIPIIFPQFGPGPIVTHGFARTALWTVVGSSEVEEGVAVTLSLTDSVESRALWPHKFRLDLTVTLTDTVATELWIENTDDHPWECTYLFHTYLKVDDSGATTVGGLAGLSFVDKVAGGTTHRNDLSELPIDRFLDRVYQDAPDELTISGVRHGEVVQLTKHDLRDVVVWNPWTDKTPSFADLAPDDYRRFLCVEAGSVAQPVVVPPGDRVVGGQILSLSLR